jgi:protein ImuA
MTALAEVLARPDVWRGDRLAQASLPALATGFDELNAELPGGGWPHGALTELLVDGSGLGELSLLLPALARIRGEGGWTLLVAPPHPLHAPAWAAAGVDLARLVVVSPAEGRDALWVLEQALTSGAPKAVLGWAPQADARAVRRLQVAAAASSATAFLFRPLRAAREASAAPLRLALAAASQGHLAVGILKRRGAPLAAPLHLTLPRPALWRDHGNRSAVAGHPPARAAVFA